MNYENTEFPKLFSILYKQNIFHSDIKSVREIKQV